MPIPAASKKVTHMYEYHIYQDDSGTLRTDLFYEFIVPLDPDIAELEYTKADGWEYISKRSPTELELAEEAEAAEAEERAWLEAGITKAKRVKLDRCPADPSHVTQSGFASLEVEVWNSADQKILLSEFNLTKTWYEMPCEVDALLVPQTFMERIKQSGLTGAAFVPVSIKDPEGPLEKTLPPLFVFQFRGKSCLRPSQVQGAENACPFCSHKPLICQSCGYGNSTCPACEKSTWTIKEQHGGPADQQLIVSPLSQREIPVLEGSRWDGSDFVYGNGDDPMATNFISKRALDWLLQVHATPFCARPVKFCIDGMSDQQQKQLAEIQKSIPS